MCSPPRSSLLYNKGLGIVFLFSSCRGCTASVMPPPWSGAARPMLIKVSYFLVGTWRTTVNSSGGLALMGPLLFTTSAGGYFFISSGK